MRRSRPSSCCDYVIRLDGQQAIGFIAAGPWDLIGHTEVPETKTDGKIARHLDRDDMVANTIGTFSGVTVHCAQCHAHKPRLLLELPGT